MLDRVPTFCGEAALRRKHKRAANRDRLANGDRINSGRIMQWIVSSSVIQGRKCAHGGIRKCWSGSLTGALLLKGSDGYPTAHSSFLP